MKKNIKYIVAAVAGLWLTGCTDDLDRFPLSSLSPETYFNTEEELETFTNHFYSQFPSAASGYGESEDIVNIFTLPATTIGLTRTVPTKGGGWNWEYLREINLYLKYSHRCNNKIAREHYDGIARFFRAYFYFEKVKRFGDVPWYNKPLESNDPDLKKPRDSRQLVMDSIMSDIDYAIEYCNDNPELYRVTKWTAMALKSRICLFEGTFRKYHGIAGHETFLEECATISKRFIDESPYSIYTSGDKPYRDLFASMNAIQQEVILARDYDYTKGVKHEANYNTMAQTYGRPGMNKKIVNSYLMTNGDRFTDQHANPDPYLCAPETGYRNVTGPNKGVILEIRRERTIELCLEGHRYYDIIRWKEGKMFEQPFLGMYFPGLTQGSGDNRYDVFDMNDGIAGDKEKVDICIYTGKKPSVKNIRKFYKLGEEFVLTDGDKGNIICHDIEKEPRQWNEERDYFFPIPTTERSLTNGALTQNPGWNDGLDF